MKRISWRLGLTAACAALTMFSQATPVLAAEEDRGGPADRLDRLEQRVNEMAQRQQQLMRRLGAQQECQAPMALADRPGIGHPMPPPEAPALSAPPTCPMKCCKHLAGLVKLCMLAVFVFNILLAVWIFTDIRKRGEGSGIFIALALLAGIPAAIIYSIVRIGDKKT